MNKKNTIHYNQYAPLKAEMQEIVAIQSNYIIAMYTITVAIIGIGLQFDNVWLLLLPYVVLFFISENNSGKKRCHATHSGIHRCLFGWTGWI